MERLSLVPALALCAALLVSHSASAATPEVQFIPRIGQGSLSVDEAFRLPDSDPPDRTVGVGASLGYLTSPGIVLEIGVDSFGQWDFADLFDSFSLVQQYASVGYQAELGNGWRLVPRVGRARYKLRVEEGQIFNPGPEALSEVRGWDYYWEVSLSRRISRVVALGLDYKQGNYNFGTTRSVTFLVTLGF